jgi:hypothetical protein
MQKRVVLMTMRVCALVLLILSLHLTDVTAYEWGQVVRIGAQLALFWTAFDLADLWWESFFRD